MHFLFKRHTLTPTEKHSLQSFHFFLQTSPSCCASKNNRNTPFIISRFCLSESYDSTFFISNPLILALFNFPLIRVDGV